MLRLSMSSACWRAALKSASSHFSSGRPFATRGTKEKSRARLCGAAACFAEFVALAPRTAKCGTKFFMPVKKSAADANRAEAHHHVPTGGGPAETQHRAEAREE